MHSKIAIGNFLPILGSKVKHNNAEIDPFLSGPDKALRAASKLFLSKSTARPKGREYVWGSTPEQGTKRLASWKSRNIKPDFPLKDVTSQNPKKGHI